MDRALLIKKHSLMGISKREIAKKQGITVGTVNYWFKKLNLKGKFDHNETGHKSPKHFDCIGKKYGYLLIKNLKRTEPRGDYIAICKCLLCKTVTEKNLQNILRGSITSCGCRRDQYKKMAGSNSSQFTGYKGLSGSFWGKLLRRMREKKLVNKL